MSRDEPIVGPGRLRLGIRDDRVCMLIRTAQVDVDVPLTAEGADELARDLRAFAAQVRRQRRPEAPAA